VGDGLAGLLPYLPGVPFAAATVVLFNLWRGSNRQHAETAAALVRDLRAERADHERTQQALDEERERRRKVEDEMAMVRREVAALRAEVAGLRHQLGEAT